MHWTKTVYSIPTNSILNKNRQGLIASLPAATSSRSTVLWGMSWLAAKRALPWITLVRSSPGTSVTTNNANASSHEAMLALKAVLPQLRTVNTYPSEALNNNSAGMCESAQVSRANQCICPFARAPGSRKLSSCTRAANSC
jgi:hypothetical protein